MHLNNQIRDLNQLYSKFWSDIDAKRRTANATTIQSAVEWMDSDRRTSLFKSQHSFESFVLRIMRIEAAFKSALARKGGRASKKDALQLLIERLVEQNPALTQPALLEKLHLHRHPDGIIDDIGDETISFFDRGRVRDVPISGLKDRLSRARKRLRSR